MNQQTLDLDTIKAGQKATWSCGDYAVVARNLEASALEFLERVAIEPDARVLDVACGAGQLAIPAAKAGARVVGIDIAPNLVEQARERADAEKVDARFDEGDAEALPYEDASFDVVLSLIGAMFAPRPEVVASELKRVCRPGGRIVMGNWTPEGFIGSFFKLVAGYLPPPEGVPSPLEWGKEDVVRDRFAEGIAHLDFARLNYRFRYPFPPADVAEYYITYFGPTNRAHDSLDETGKRAFRDDLEKLWAASNQARNGSTYLEAELLEVHAVRARS